MQGNYVERARALLGTRFRAQGRSAQTGLDCVGFIIAAHGIAVDAVRRDYRLRGNHKLEVEEQLKRFFRRIRPTLRRPGDVMLLTVSEEQLHLAIFTGAGFIHADAGIGRVVETPGEPKWPVLGIYRKRARPRRRD